MIEVLYIIIVVSIKGTAQSAVSVVVTYTTYLMHSSTASANGVNRDTVMCIQIKTVIHVRENTCVHYNGSTKYNEGHDCL